MRIFPRLPSLPVAIIGVAAVGILLLYVLAKPGDEAPSDAAVTPIRIGWQIPWATQGQLAQILKHTDLLDQQGLHGEFKGFSYGGPLNEAALAGEVDVLFTADQPAAMLLAKDKNWTIIGRLLYNRVSLYVPPQSPIRTVEELRGKTVGMPFGAAAQRVALAVQREAGLDPARDVHNINVGIYEQSDLVRDPTAAQWGNLHALAGFDPTPAILEEKGLIRNLATGKIVSVIVMSNQFIERYPDAPARFLTTFYRAYDFYRQNPDQADAWFAAESGLDVTPAVLSLAASIEPNLWADQQEIRLGFNDDDYRIMQEAADFIYDHDLVQERIELRNFINVTYLDQVVPHRDE